MTDQTQLMLHQQMKNYLETMTQKIEQDEYLPPYCLLETAMISWLLDSQEAGGWLDKIDKKVYDSDDLKVITNLSDALQKMMHIYAMFKQDAATADELSAAIVHFMRHAGGLLSMISVMIKATNDANMQLHLDLINEFEGRLDRLLR